MDQITREEWLEKAVDYFRDDFLKAGKPLPQTVHVSIGFPPRGGTSTTRKVLGCAFKPECAEDNIVQIFLNPSNQHETCAERGVLSVLVHELIHAAGVFDHNKEFKRVMEYVGLEGKATSTDATLQLMEFFREKIVPELGEFPHAVLTPISKDAGSKKDSTRMLKCACECGYTIRLTKKWAEMGLPTCPLCQGKMELESKYDTKN